MRRTALAVALALISGPLLAAGSGAGHNRYKWTDASGNLHYGDALPPEAVNFGYEVVNPQGVVIKHVDRPKTSEERAAAKVEIAKAQAAKEAADARVRNDQQLIAAYPTEDDLKRAQRQQADMLDQNIASAQLSLESQQKSLAELLGHAADLDSSGKPVPAELAKRIGDMRKQVEDQRALIVRKQSDRDQAVAKFDDDLAHYRTLVTKTKAQ
jgi:hypothetical protein